MAAVRVRLDRAPAHKLHPLEGFGAQFNANIFRPASMFPAADRCEGGSTQGPDAGSAERAPGNRQEPEAGAQPHLHSPGAGRRPSPSGEGARSAAAVGPARAARRRERESDLLGPGIVRGQGKAEGVEVARAGPARLAARRRSSKGGSSGPTSSGRGSCPAPAELMRRFANIIKLARAEGACITHVTIQNEPNGVGTDIAVKGSPEAVDADVRMALPAPGQGAPRARRSAQQGSDAPQTRSSSSAAISSWKATRARKPGSRTCAPTWTFRARSSRAFSTATRSTSTGIPATEPIGFPRKLEKRLESLPKTLRELGIDRPLYVTEYGVKKQGAPQTGAGRSRQRPDDRVLGRGCVPARLVQRPGAAIRLRGLRQVGSLPHRRPGALRRVGDDRRPQSARPPHRLRTIADLPGDAALQSPGRARMEGGRARAGRQPHAAGEQVHEREPGVGRGPQPGPKPREVVVEGLKPRTPYFVAVWNQDGSGGPAELLAAPITSTAAREVTVDVPPNGVVGLSTRRLRL